LNTGLAFVIDM